MARSAWTVWKLKLNSQGLGLLGYGDRKLTELPLKICKVSLNGNGNVSMLYQGHPFHIYLAGHSKPVLLPIWWLYYRTRNIVISFITLYNAMLYYSLLLSPKKCTYLKLLVHILNPAFNLSDKHAVIVLCYREELTCTGLVTSEWHNFCDWPTFEWHNFCDWSKSCDHSITFMHAYQNWTWHSPGQLLSHWVTGSTFRSTDRTGDIFKI